MTRVTWHVDGKRFFETGLDRGMLYTDVALFGVPWPGLIAVTNRFSGGEPSSHYVDGVKYLNVLSATDFEATLSAFYAPDEFNECDGMNSPFGGLFFTQQPRKSFALSYRSRIGNDTDGVEHSYKIHLVYGCVAAPSEREYVTLDDNPEAGVSAWDISTLAPPIIGRRRTAHVVIDARLTDPLVLAAVEDALYGTETTPPRMLLPEELMIMFTPPDEE